jgi:ubiquinone biosynthesis protein
MSQNGDNREDLARLREIASLMSAYGFASAVEKIPLLKRFSSRLVKKQESLPPGERFAQFLEKLGPTFIKVGQILSTRQDLLPQDFTQPLSRLQDDAPAFGSDQAKQLIEAELKESIPKLFLEFSDEPMASASMAQVHAAKLLDGRHVVVKVQRPGIENQVRTDAAILVVVAQLLERIVMEARDHHAAGLAKEFKDALHQELDFRIEAKNLQTFAKLNQHREGIHVPFLVPEYSTSRIMVMEKIEGFRITDQITNTSKEVREKRIERLIALTFDHIFVDGFFHGDPHPGNILVTEKGDLAFIDFGLMGKVPRESQDRILLLNLALSLQDADVVSKLIVRIGDPDDRVVMNDLRSAVRGLLDRYMGARVGDVNASQALSDLIELSTRFGVQMPPSFAILSKATVAIEGIVRSQHAGFDPIPLLKEKSKGLLLERIDPRQAKAGGLRTLLHVTLLMQELPLQLGQTLLDMERGQVRIEMVSEDLKRLERNIRGLGMTVFGGLMSCALILGGIYALSKYDWRILGIPALPTIAFSLSGILFGVAFSWFITGGSTPRFRIRKLFKWISPQR